MRSGTCCIVVVMNKKSSTTLVDSMLVFDIDGVLTDPRTTKFNKTLLERISADLQKGVPVALNTGRQTQWVFEKLLPHLQGRVSAQDLDHLLLVAEKGGVRVEFDTKSAEPRVVEDREVALPDQYMTELSKFLEVAADDNTLFDHYVRWDTGKRTVASFEKLPEVSMEEFERVRGRLYEHIELFLEQHGLSEFHIDESITATDVEHQKAGKHKGAEQILNWLKKRGERIGQFYSFGDTPSDETMAAVFAQHAKSIFVYVGIKALPENQHSQHERVVMRGRFDADAAEYLTQIS